MNLKDINTILLDGDGVLWVGDQSMPGLKRLFRVIERHHLNWALVTNNSSRTVADTLAKLQRFGISADESHIFTSPKVTAAHILEQYGPRASVHAVGHPGLIQTLREAGLIVTHGEQMPDHHVTAVVCGLDRKITYDKIKIAMRLILGGARFIAANTDRAFMASDGICPGSGMITGAIQAATGVAPYVIGKPEPVIFQAALNRYGIAPESACMVGDRLDTDIAGAKQGWFKNPLTN